MRQFIRLLSVGATLLTMGFTASAAQAQATHLIENQRFQHYTDKGAKGESPGDIRSFGGPLYDRRGHRVGHDRIRCVVESQGSRCRATLVLGRGKLYARALVTGPEFTADITGGTRHYAHARGSLTVVSGEPSRYTLKLRS
jgi:hypothetical protein